MGGDQLSQGGFDLDGAPVVIRKTNKLMQTADDGRIGSDRPRLTIFAIPKPFEGHSGVIQRNAIRSWANLKPEAEIILFGNACPGLEEIASEVDARVLPMRVNRFGTPLLSDAFTRAMTEARGATCCYVNADIVFGPELPEVVERLLKCAPPKWLGIGRRTNLDVTSEWTGETGPQVERLMERARSDGRVDSVVCKDFFLFPPDVIGEIPEFLVGRGNWDNWIVAEVKSRQIPVVDLSRQLSVIHQNHDYSHVEGGRKNAYVFGEEARENQRLAGGRNLISGSTATWKLTDFGLKRRSFPVLTMFWDLPRFVRLLRNLLFLGYIAAGTSFTL